MSIHQLKTYVNTLPWYTRIFFSQVIWNCLQQESITTTEIQAIYASKIQGSWLESFYSWLFPELILFIQIPFEEVLPVPVAPSEEIIQLPVNYERALKEAITDLDNSKFNQLVCFLSMHEFDNDTLIRILQTSMIRERFEKTCILLKQTAFSTEVVSRAFVEAIKSTNKDWLGINMLIACGIGNNYWMEMSDRIIQAFDGLIPLRAKISAAAINEVILIRAKDYQEIACHKDSYMIRRFHFRVEQDLRDILSNSRMRCKITLETITQLLKNLIIPLKFEWDDSSQLVHDILNFKDSEGNQLNSNEHQIAYLKSIEVGRIKTFEKFPEDLVPAHDERVIQALRNAAKNAHYDMVLRLIKKIPSTRRFEILQTKAGVQNNKQFGDWKEPKFPHILQWAACRSVTEDIHTILDALDNLEERYTLITHSPGEDDYSPLLLTSINCRRENFSIMLNALSDEQAMKAILPYKVTFYSPLNQRNCYSHLNDHEIKIMPIILAKVFGENQKLYAAYHYLKRNLSWKTLYALRDHYLSTYFPTYSQTNFHFFIKSYSIPGHSLNKEELDKVVQVVFYQNYHEFDDVQRSKIKSRMNSMSNQVSTTELSGNVMNSRF